MRKETGQADARSRTAEAEGSAVFRLQHRSKKGPWQNSSRDIPKFRDALFICTELPYNKITMKMIDILEKDKDRLMTELAGAKTPERAAVVLGNEADKMLLQFNDQCTSEKERDAAAYMM